MLLLLLFVLVLHLEESLIHQIVVFSHLDHLLPHLISVTSVQKITGLRVKVDKLRIKRGWSLWGCCIRGIIVEVTRLLLLILFELPLLRSHLIDPLNPSSIVRVLVRIVIVGMVEQNFVLIGDPGRHITYFTYDLLTISHELTLIVSRRALDQVINSFFIIFHVLNFTLVKMRILCCCLIHFDIFLL